MKFYLSILLLFFLYGNNVLAQEFNELPTSYFPDFGRMDDGKPASIKMYENYNLTKMVNSDSVKNLKGKEQGDFYDKAFQSKEVEMKPGNYFIDNDRLYFKFHIDKNGLLTGEANFTDRYRNTETVFNFLSGIAINSTTQKFDKISSRTSLKDSIFLSELFDKDGVMVTKDIINLKLGGGQSNTISTHYFKNGKVSSNQNNIDETFVAYYDNGKIERQTDKKKNAGKEFDKTGKMESQYYVKNNERCEEEYTGGIIISKKCRSEKENKVYYYKNGQLDFYEVQDNNSGKTKVYDAKGKLIIKESIMDKVPTIGNK